jgi:hypothetical protein
MMEMIELAGGTSKNLHVAVDVDRVATEMREDLMVDEIKDVNYKTFTPKISMYNSVVAGLTQAEMPTLNGFYGVKAKQDAEVVLMGEYSPLYAQWKYGKGMVGSFMCDLNGVWSADVIGTDAATKLINNIVTTLFPVENIRSKEPGISVIPISVQNQVGMGAAKKAIIELVNKLIGISEVETLSKTKVFGSDFMSLRSVDEDMEIQYPGSEQ